MTGKRQPPNLKALLCLGLGIWVSELPTLGQDMPLSDILIAGQHWRPIDRRFKAIEDLASDAQGNVFVLDGGQRRIERIAGDGRISVFAEEVKGVHGLAFGPDGRLYASQTELQRIVIIDEGGQGKVVADGVAAERLVITRTGAIYCSVPTEHAVYLIDAQGNKRLVDKGLAKPVGLTLWPDHGTLVVADGGDKSLWTYRIEADGSLAHKERYYHPLRLPAGEKKASGASGLTADTAGRVYVASPAGIQVFDPAGRLSGVILKPADTSPTALAFGGTDRDLLYVACGDQVYVRKTRAKGVLSTKSAH